VNLLLRSLREWRRYAEIIACIVEEMLGGEAEVYAVGGAAEGRLTALSDIDIVVALDHEPSYSEAVQLRAEILERAERRGLPLHAPIELHFTAKNRVAGYGKAERIECRHEPRPSAE